MKNKKTTMNTESDESIARALAEQEEQARQRRQSPQVFEYPGDLRRRQQQHQSDPTAAPCPGGCGPLQVRIATSSVVCNACNRIMTNDELDHACPMCDYHECELCRIKRENPPSRGTVVQGRNLSTGRSPPAAVRAIPSSYVPPQPQPQPFFIGRRRTPMCQIPCVVGPNSVCVEMMVDTGAESSVISAQLAKELGIYSSIDTREQGIASGVGQARILGKIRNAIVTLGHVEFSMEFMVLQVPGRLMLLGLDEMRKYKCIVDLEKDVLVFGGSGGVEVPMLPPDQQNGFAVPPGIGGACTIS